MDRQKEQTNLHNAILGIVFGEIEKFRVKLSTLIGEEISRHFLLLKEKDNLEEEES